MHVHWSRTYTCADIHFLRTCTVTRYWLRLADEFGACRVILIAYISTIHVLRAIQSDFMAYNGPWALILVQTLHSPQGAQI